MSLSNLIKTALDKDYPLHSMEEGLRRRYYFEAYSRSEGRTKAYYNSKEEAEDDLPNFAYYIYSCCRRKWQNVKTRDKSKSFIYDNSFIQGRNEYLIRLAGTVGATEGLVDMIVDTAVAPTYAAAAVYMMKVEMDDTTATATAATPAARATTTAATTIARATTTATATAATTTAVKLTAVATATTSDAARVTTTAWISFDEITNSIGKKSSYLKEVCNVFENRGSCPEKVRKLLMEKNELDRKLKEANASIAELQKNIRKEHNKVDFKFEQLDDIDFKNNILKLGNTEEDFDIFEGIGRANEKRIVNKFFYCCSNILHAYVERFELYNESPKVCKKINISTTIT